MTSRAAGPWTAIHYVLNASLVDWAYLDWVLQLDHPISGLRRRSREFLRACVGYLAATRLPFETIGDSSFQQSTGMAEYMNQWANDWVSLQVRKDANFMMGRHGRQRHHDGAAALS